MAATAKKTDPKLWDRVKARVTKGSKGGEAGEWSARKAQLAVAEYKKAGGGYEGAKAKDNHLSQWTKEEWGTKSGRESGETHERYLPRKARESLSDEEYARTTAAKRKDTSKGQQFSAQPKDVARKTAKARATGKAAPKPAPRKATARKAPATGTRRTASATPGTAAKTASGRAAPAARKAPAKRAAPASRAASRAAPAAGKAPAKRPTPARKAAPAAKRPPAATKRATAGPAAPKRAAAKPAARKAPAARRAKTTSTEEKRR